MCSVQYDFWNILGPAFRRSHKMCVPVLKCCQLQGGFAPWPPPGALIPGLPGPRYRLVLSRSQYCRAKPTLILFSGTATGVTLNIWEVKVKGQRSKVKTSAVKIFHLQQFGYGLRIWGVICPWGMSSLHSIDVINVGIKKLKKNVKNAFFIPKIKKKRL